MKELVSFFAAQVGTSLSVFLLMFWESNLFLKIQRSCHRQFGSRFFFIYVGWYADKVVTFIDFKALIFNSCQIICHWTPKIFSDILIDPKNVRYVRYKETSMDKNEDYLHSEN